MKTYDEWFTEKVEEAKNSKKPSIPHEEVMKKIKVKLESKWQFR